MIYFYARVSTKEQNLERQLNDAKQFGVDRIFSDKESGEDFDRAAYQEMISVLREGDLVVVSSIDRFGRDYDEIGTQWELITKEIKADIKVLDMDILDTRKANDLTGTLISDIVLKLLSYVADIERKKIKARQKEGIAVMPIVNGKKVSLKTGRTYGRQPLAIDDEFEKFLEKQKRGEISVKECCKALNISRSTWYNRVSEVEAC